MNYRIVYQQSEGQSSEPWGGTLEDAKAQAINSVVTGGSFRADTRSNETLSLSIPRRSASEFKLRACAATR